MRNRNFDKFKSQSSSVSICDVTKDLLSDFNPSPIPIPNHRNFIKSNSIDKLER